MPEYKKGVLEEVAAAGSVVLGSHFAYGDGSRHGLVYVGLDKLVTHAPEMGEIARNTAGKIKREFLLGPNKLRIDGIAEFDQFGLAHAYLVGNDLAVSTGQEQVLVFPFEGDGADRALFLREDQRSDIQGKNILVSVDVVITGRRLRTLGDAVRAYGGTVIAACAVINGNPEQVNEGSIGLPFLSVDTFGTMSRWKKINDELREPIPVEGDVRIDPREERMVFDAGVDSCPMCRAKIPIINVGHGLTSVFGKLERSVG